MAKRWRRKLIAAKLESAAEKQGGAQGNGAAPGAADAVLLAEGVDLSPAAGDTVDRGLQRVSFGNSEEFLVGVHATLSFSVELAAKAGFAYPWAAGDQPPWGVLMQACGMAETLTAGAQATGSVAWTPTSGDSEMLTLLAQIDGVQHRIIHAKGTWQLTFAANAVPRIRFAFTGLYADPTDAPLLAGGYVQWGKPILPSVANTPTCTVHGTSLALRSLELDYGNEVNFLEAIGADSEVSITDRKPTGSLTVRAPSVADFALVKKAKEGASGVLAIVHGRAAGPQIKIDAPKLALSSPSYSEDTGLWMAQANVRPLPVAGNDELKISIA